MITEEIMEELTKINKTYGEKVKEEDYENDRNNDIMIASTGALGCALLVGTEADRDTFGEFTRRFERYYEELNELLRT